MSLDINKLWNKFGTHKPESQDEKDLKRYNELQHKSETLPAGSLTEAELKELDELKNHLGRSGKIRGGGAPAPDVFYQAQHANSVLQNILTKDLKNISMFFNKPEE